MEKLAQFDRERIPERVVHARGAVAKGFFEVGAVGGLCPLSPRTEGAGLLCSCTPAMLEDFYIKSWSESWSESQPFLWAQDARPRENVKHLFSKQRSSAVGIKHFGPEHIVAMDAPSFRGGMLNA